MTSNITQHVIPRQRSFPILPQAILSNIGYRSTYRHLSRQRGSISSHTVTLMLGLTVIMALTFLSFFYLGQVLGTASQGTSIQDLEDRMTQLRDQQRSLELEGAELRSIEAIEQHVSKVNLLSADQVTYLTADFDRVATLVE